MNVLCRMLVVAALVAVTAPAGADDAPEIAGAGATFPYPVYAKWADAYHRETGVKLNYQSIGSGGGIRQIKARTVDFGASDAPLKAAELARQGLVQFPMVLGGVVPVVHIRGIPPGQIRLSGTVLADIYLGEIKKWNDPAISALNPGVDLPSRGITVVYRSDGSGTTWIYTNYLAKVSKRWAARVGNGKAVAWPVGIGGKGNEGVASYVSRINGSIGYVEYAYALQNHMSHIKLENRAGHFVDPTSESFEAAAASADWQHAQGFYRVLTDQPGVDSWPIAGASFILIHRRQSDPATAKAMLGFFDWAFHNGAAMAGKLGYVPIPEKVIKLVEQSWVDDVRGPDGSPVWTP